MAKAIRTIGVIAGAVALIATGVGAFAVAGSAVAGIAGSVATYASLAAGVAGIAAAALTKPPPARGSVTAVVISPDAPMPYAMGEGLIGGVVRHDVAYGAPLKKIPNPHRFMPMVLSLGPVLSFTPYVDQAPISSYYTGFLFTTTQVGKLPQPAALAPQWAGAPGWTTASKLSGKAAIGWSLLFDNDGKRFASGVPGLGAYGQWVKVYDPRLDSTQPGGSGAHRAGVESTYTWSANPALHAGTYALGRWHNGKRVFGIGQPADAIAWSTVAAWANTCDLNGWTIFGRIFEPGDRWANLSEIAMAGGGVPLFAGGLLSFHFAAPRVALDTATDADLAAGPHRVTAMATLRQRQNGIVPKCISPAHNWELIDLAKVSVPAYVTEDGEENTDVVPFNLVKDANQAAELAAYRLVDGRELQPLEITYGPRMFAYRPGDCLHLLHPEGGLDTLAVILHRRFDPVGLTVTFTFIGETAAKHAFALGQTAVAPPTPALGQSAAARDALAAAATSTPSAARRLVEQSNPFPVVSDDDEIGISGFTGVLDDGRALTFPTATLAGLASSTEYAVFYDPAQGTYSAVTIPVDTQMANSDLVFIQWQATSSAGTFPTPITPPHGYGGAGVAWDQFAQ